MPGRHNLLQSLLVAQVNLVDEQDHRHLHGRHLLHKVVVLVGCLHHVGHVEQHVSIHQGRGGEVKHRLLQFVVGFEHAGRVGEHYLHVVGVVDAHDAVAGSLRLKGGDGDPFADQNVHQG